MLQHRFIDSARAHGDKPAFIDRSTGRDTSYREALLAALVLARRFRQLERGRIGIMLPTSSAAALAVVGAVMGGLTPVISEQSSATLQEQILNQIRARILSGELLADSPLPSIRALARDLKVSVITVQRAYETLQSEGLLYARRGKGFFVAALADGDKSALAQQRFSGRLADLLGEARRDGLSDADLERLFARHLRDGD